MKQEDLDIWKEVIKSVTPLKEKGRVSLFQRLFRRSFLKRKPAPLSTFLDLHRFTLQEGFDAFKEFIEEHAELGTQRIIVITGKGQEGKGVLRKEFPLWATRNGIKEKILKVEQAPSHLGGDGAFLVYLKRKKSYVSNGNRI